MILRRKPFLTYFALCAAPLLLLAGLNCWNGFRAIDSTVGSIAQEDLSSFNAGVDEVLREELFSIERLEQAGVDRALLDVPSEPADSVLPLVERYAELAARHR